jgi:DNA-binding NarL/FixJ family response regulator
VRACLADDSYPLRERLRSWLRSLGFEIAGVASNARDAYDMCAKEKPDLVVLDIIMAPGSGKETAIRVADEKLATHVLVVSLSSQDAIVREFEPHGVHLLVKPLSKEQFVAKVEAIINGHAR